jgi:hypothetical protein
MTTYQEGLDALRMWLRKDFPLFSRESYVDVTLQLSGEPSYWTFMQDVVIVDIAQKRKERLRLFDPRCDAISESLKAIDFVKTWEEASDNSAGVKSTVTPLTAMGFPLAKKGVLQHDPKLPRSSEQDNWRGDCHMSRKTWTPKPVDPFQKRTIRT